MGRIRRNSLPLAGTIQAVTFYQSNGQDLFRRQSSLTGERFKKEKAFEAVRRHGTEFGAASEISRGVRYALNPLLQQITHGPISGNLLSAILKVIKSDPLHEKGKRCLEDGDLELLEGYQLNDQCSLKQAFRADYSSSIDWDTGAMKITIPSFIPESQIKAPAAATHCKILAGIAPLNWAGYRDKDTIRQSELIALNDMPTIPMQILLSSTGGRESLALVLGIAFYNVSENGEATPILQGAMQIVQAGIKPGKVAVTTTVIQQTESITALIIEKEPVQQKALTEEIITSEPALTPSERSYNSEQTINATADSS